LNRFWEDQSGAAAAEYVIILAIIGSALAVAILLLSDAIATAINDTTSCIKLARLEAVKENPGTIDCK
jgi:pilus assembly protein Flp/PilA